MSKFFIFLFAMFVFLFLAVFGIFYIDEVLEKEEIDIDPFVVNDFESCIQAEDSIILESYPRQCRAKNGNSFTEYIGNELELIDLIMLNNPRPNQEILSPLTILGLARGPWFFEGDFPVQLLDSRGKEIALGVASASDSWTTDNFISFRATLEFDAPIIFKSGTLILRKANPSALAQNDAQLEVPIKFQSKSALKKREKDGCVITGCSSQICSDNKVITSCQYFKEYACYKSAICEKQDDGECDWEATKELAVCLEQS